MIFNNQSELRPDRVNAILKLADDFDQKTKGQLVYCLDEGRFYIYENGYWHGLQKKEDELWLFKHEEICYLNKSQRKDFIDLLGTVKQVPLNKFNDKEILNLENGILDLETEKFIKHSPDYLSTIRLPYKYDPKALHPNLDYFLESSLEGNQERIDLLQEFCGYCLGRDNSFHKSMVLIGEGRNGKGTTFRMIKKLIGRENLSSISLSSIMKEDRVSMLVNKLVNIDADCDTNAKGFESGFRSISAGDDITGKRLYKDVFTFTPFCKLIIGANELPRIADKTHGFYDRLIIIPFNVSFVGREDRDLDNKIESELSGILNWALEGRKRLYKNGKFSMTVTMKDYVDELKRNNNPVEVFVHENIGFDNNCRILKGELYELYEKFCKADGYHPLSKIRFGQEFYRICGRRTQKDARMSHTYDRSPIWPNVFIREVNDPVLEEAKEVLW